MGMNMILTIIAGIVMTTMVGTQVAPNIIDQIKVKKTQVQTINNQEVIFEAIKRYTTIKQVAPTSIQDLIDEGYLEANVNNNGFGEEYTINIDKALGVATITTTIEDPKVQEAFLNSFTSMSKPTCTGTIVDGVCDTNEFKTTFVLPNEVMHGNALLMTGIPIQATAPTDPTQRYWYDTSSGKAVLKLYSGASWIEVKLGGSGEDEGVYVKLTGNQTIDGIKTFTSFPITPSSEPTSNYQVANKKYVDENGSPAGTVSAFAGTTAPVGYLFCRGQEVSRTTYSKLFAAIGTLYGAGNGSTTFNVPDLRGKFIRGNGSTTFNSGGYGNITHSSLGLGITQGDSIRNIYGTIGSSWSADHATLDFLTGAFKVNTYSPRGDVPGHDGSLSPQIANFNSSLVVPTANENRPINMAMNYIIKY